MERGRVAATLALTTALGTYVTAAATSMYFALRMFPDRLPRPPRFCLMDQSMLLGYNGASATIIPLLVLATLPLLRRHGRAPGRLVQTALRSASILLAGGLVMEVLQLLLMAELAYRPLQAVGQVCDVLAVAAVAGVVLASVPGKTLLLDPRWSWRLALLVAVFPGLLTTIGKVGYSEQVFLWLRVGAAPAALALFYDASLRQREASLDAGMRNLLGVIFFVASAIFLHAALLLTSTKSGVIQSANIVTLVVVSANSLALLGVALWQAWRAPRDRVDQLGSCLGLLFLACATFPRYQPPWIKNTFGLLMRLTLVPSQAMTGLGLLAGLWVFRWLRRHDPLGGPPPVLRPIWFGLCSAFLISEAASDWIWTYEIWVKQIQMVSDVILRLRFTNGFVLLGATSLLALIPSVRRAVTRVLGAGEGQP